MGVGGPVSMSASRCVDGSGVWVAGLGGGGKMGGDRLNRDLQEVQCKRLKLKTRPKRAWAS